MIIVCVTSDLYIQDPLRLLAETIQYYIVKGHLSIESPVSRLCTDKTGVGFIDHNAGCCHLRDKDI